MSMTLPRRDASEPREVQTAVALAVMNGNAHSARVALEAGCDVNSFSGFTAIGGAISR